MADMSDNTRAEAAYRAALAAGIMRIDTWGAIPAEQAVWRGIVRAADAAARAQAEGLAGRLRGFADFHVTAGNGGTASALHEAVAALSALAVENERLRAALRPFTELQRSTLYDAGENEGYDLVLSAACPDITGQDIARAAALLSPTREAPGIAAPTEDRDG